jgi:acetoin utilization deacetylase AcuC-like enzyme
VLYFRHPSSLAHDPSLLSLDHPDIPERITAIETAMSQLGWLGCEVREAPAATEQELELVHAASHVRMIRDLCSTGGGRLDADTFVGEASYLAALHAAGGACEMVRALMRGDARAGFSAMRPSGHHAGRDFAMGFCLFNNVAIAARAAQRRLPLERIAIVDFDVHHGNGTDAIFREDDSVLYVSLHQWPFYPGSGGPHDQAETTVNVPLAAGSGDEEYLEAFERVVEPAVERFEPELVLVSAGFDAHEADPLADMDVTESGFRELARRCAGLSDRVAAVLEGGYELETLPGLVDAALDGFTD